MTSYRGKYSRNVSDDGESPLQQGSTQRSDTNDTNRFSRAKRARTQLAETNRKDSAAPEAFRHHGAALESGSGPRHSKRKTVLIVIPIVVVLAAIVVGIVYAVGAMRSAEEDIEAGIAVTVIIAEGASTNGIANTLKKAQVISDTQAFIADVKSMNAEQSLKPGTYELETLMDSTTLINILMAGPTAGGNKLTIAEGLTAEQTAAVVETATGITEAEFLERVYAASEYVADYPFLEGVYNNSLEGFLYPKTYNVPTATTADNVIRILLDQFAIETSGLDISYAKEHDMNLFNVVTIASLIERETAVEEERALVASVIYNRLNTGMRLQIDATVIYALGSSFEGSLVSYDDLEVDSPYNTYRVDKLPAGPICSPSIASIEAAAHPASTNYYYYVLTSQEGYHTFCETSEAFEIAKAEHNRIFGIE